MKAISARRAKGMNLGAFVNVADNSGGRIAKVISVKRAKTVRGRQVSCAVSDWVKVSIKAGQPEMTGQVFDAVVIRQRKPYRRLTGERIGFYDNAVVLLKDEKGNPKGTLIKGPTAREVIERWPHVAKIAGVVV
ncbi:uL14 family ribosomal protein [Candidatus Pacearchaeota archaeon]|nr:uL14 family ribosomal protein [Candidatus Pacearchaeota archaeon]